MMKKFKKTVLAAMAAVAMMMSVAACSGGSKEDYENDIVELLELEEFDNVETADEMNDIISGIKLTTKEGKKIKKNLQKAVDLMEDAEKLVENLDDDADYITVMAEYGELMTKYSEVAEDIEESIQVFIAAAEKAGVEEDFLDDLDY